MLIQIFYLYLIGIAVLYVLSLSFIYPSVQNHDAGPVLEGGVGLLKIDIHTFVN